MISNESIIYAFICNHWSLFFRFPQLKPYFFHTFQRTFFVPKLRHLSYPRLGHLSYPRLRHLSYPGTRTFVVPQTQSFVVTQTRSFVVPLTYPGHYKVTHACPMNLTTKARKKDQQMTDAHVHFIRTRGTTNDRFWL